MRPERHQRLVGTHETRETPEIGGDSETGETPETDGDSPETGGDRRVQGDSRDHYNIRHRSVDMYFVTAYIQTEPTYPHFCN